MNKMILAVAMMALSATAHAEMKLVTDVELAKSTKTAVSIAAGQIRKLDCIDLKGIPGEGDSAYVDRVLHASTAVYKDDSCS
jgi:hypothetical protein